MDTRRNLLNVLCLTVLSNNVGGAVPKTEFNEVQTNITVMEGGTAVLPCAIVNLGDHKVVWTDEQSRLLTYQNRRIRDDTRLSVERPSIQDWNLHIRDVVYTDRGKYVCYINTTPTKQKTLNLDVIVPPKIIEEFSSGDQTVEEGDNLELVCNVTGVPKPVVKWYRVSRGEVVQSLVDVFTVQNVSRYDSGTYRCVADNGLPLTVSREMRVNVQFAPEISSFMNRVSGLLETDPVLNCEIFANPLQAITWLKANSNILLYDSPKYKIKYSMYRNHTMTSSLRIQDLRLEDYGEYICSTKNLLGQDQASIILEEETKLASTMEIPMEQDTATSTPTETVSGNATEKTKAEPQSEEMLRTVQLEYYREQILTDRKWRRLIDSEKTFYEAISKFLQQKEEENTQ